MSGLIGWRAGKARIMEGACLTPLWIMTLSCQASRSLPLSSLSDPRGPLTPQGVQRFARKRPPAVTAVACPSRCPQLLAFHFSFSLAGPAMPT